MFKKRKVVMLPTNEKANLVLKNATNQLMILPTGHIGTNRSLLTQPQNLYFLLDEEIKDGDWFVMNGCIVRQCESTNKEPHTIHTVVDSTGSIHHVSVCEKIIATTDTSLTEKIEMLGTGSTYIFNLPQPSQSFIEKFVEEYNKGNVITEVMVEYIDEGEEDWFGDDYNGEPFWNEKIVLKVNPKDNTITIRKMKDSWNREEVIALLHHFKFCGDNVEEFVEQNL